MVKDFFLNKKGVIVCVILVLIASAIDWGAYKAKYTLSQTGSEEPSAAMLTEKILAGDTDTALLIVRSGILYDQSPAEMKEIFTLSLHEENTAVASALLPKCNKLTEADRADCLRGTLVDRHFISSKWLVENGFSKDILMDNKMSPMDWSIIGSDEETSHHLIQLGFPLTETKGKVSSLEQALSAKSSPKLVSALIAYGADQNAYSSSNEPLLHKAIKQSSTDTVRAMVLI